MSANIIINEIHPNQESGSEWVELLLSDDASEVNLLNYTLFDSAKQIYKFSNEQFSEQLLVVEVSGLNNDQDSVILKDQLGNVLDSFSYTSTQKGLSWTRLPSSNEFVLLPPSRLELNPTPTPTPTPTSTPSPTPTPTAVVSSSPSPSPSQKPSVTPLPSSNPTLTQYPHYSLDEIQLQATTSARETRLSRLVLIGQKTAPTQLKNAIIGSLLLVFASTYLLYAKFKKHHP